MAAAPTPSLVTKVSLAISCKALICRDVTSESDPLVQVMMLQNNSWKEIGRTELIKNTANPEFAETVEVDYMFEQVQKMKFNVFDIDNATVSLGDDDKLGTLECNLANIVSSRTFTKPLSHHNHKNMGTITICAEEISQGNTEVRFSFQGTHLDKKDTFGKSDPYLEILKLSAADNTFKPVHRTPRIDNTLNPKWEAFHMTLQKLCGGDYDLKLKFRCFDYDSDGDHDLIGEFETSMAEMVKADKVSLQWDLINPKKKLKKKHYKNSGVIILDSIKVTPVYSFLDYIMSGCQINFTVGIDFTGSNGQPTQPNSLHYMDPHRPNQYVQSLISVGEICQDYDTDKMFPALGFGAKIPPNMELSFEFPLNFNNENPYCFGINGIVQAYQYCIPQIQLWGPTNVAPIVNHVARVAQSTNAGQEDVASNYFILLLLTDGEITDLDHTVSAIVQASFLPMSLIIVGVGNADFEAMEALDCDRGKLRDSRGQEALRDIVQFVPFRDYIRASPAELARCVLAEVPKQVSEYFKIRGIKPKSVQ